MRHVFKVPLFAQVLFIALLGFCSALYAHENMQANQNQCLSCHNIQITPEFPGPQLGDQDEDYIYQQMHNFQNGLRGQGSKQAAMMAKAVASLSEEELTDLADWASSLESETLFEPDQAKQALGYQIYEAKCQGCHNSFMGRMMTSSPRLDKFDADYIIRQLYDFRTDQRRINVPSEHQSKMLSVIKSLSEDEIISLNEFIKQAAPANDTE